MALNQGRRSLDSQTLAAFGTTCVDNSAAAACFHADQKAVGTGAAGLGGLVCAFHDRSLMVQFGRTYRQAQAGRIRRHIEFALNTFRETRDYHHFLYGWQLPLCKLAL